MRFQLEIEIKRPPEEVFERLTDVERLPEWQSSAVRVEAPDPLELGSAFAETRRFLGREFKTKLRVTAYQPPTRFDVESVEAPLPLKISHTLDPTNSGTRLQVISEAKVSGLKRFAAAAAAGTAEAEFRKDFDRLKTQLEFP